MTGEIVSDVSEAASQAINITTETGSCPTAEILAQEAALSTVSGDTTTVTLVDPTAAQEENPIILDEKGNVVEGAVKIDQKMVDRIVTSVNIRKMQQLDRRQYMNQPPINRHQRRAQEKRGKKK